MMRGESGQATVEYVFVCMGVLIALATIAVAGRQACIENIGGALSPSACSTPLTAIGAAMRQSVEEITYLINLPL